MASTDITQRLRDALKDVVAERDAKKDAIDREYAQQIEGYERALAELGENGLSVEDQRPYTQLSIGDDRLDFIRQYVHENPDTTQAEVTGALAAEFNISLNNASGAASTGLRRLELEGFVTPAPKKRGSNGWTLVGCQDGGRLRSD